MRKIIWLISIYIICFLAFSCAFAQEAETINGRRIGIISAMETEIELLMSHAEIEYEDFIGGIVYHVGTLCGKDVVIVQAGIGKVLAAAGTAALLNRYDISSLIFTGVAGGVGNDTNLLDMVIGTKLVQHDFGKMLEDGFHWTPGYDNSVEGYYLSDESLVEMAYNAAVDTVGSEHVFKGIIATGDQFVSSESFVKILQENFDAIACEMEGASVAAVCSMYNIPFVVIRAMSDKADGQAQESFDNWMDSAADNSCTIVMKILETME